MAAKKLIGAKLLVRFELDRRTGEVYDVYQNYTDLNEATIRALGYLPAKGYVEDFKYAGTKVYVKMTGFERYDIRADEEPNLETSGTLADYFMSDTQKEFLKGMSKVQFDTLDMKKLGGIAVVGIGIVLGLLLLSGSLRCACSPTSRRRPLRF